MFWHRSTCVYPVYGSTFLNVSATDVISRDDLVLLDDFERLLTWWPQRKTLSSVRSGAVCIYKKNSMFSRPTQFTPTSHDPTTPPNTLVAITSYTSQHTSYSRTCRASLTVTMKPLPSQHHNCHDIVQLVVAQLGDGAREGGVVCVFTLFIQAPPTPIQRHLLNPHVRI